MLFLRLLALLAALPAATLYAYNPAEHDAFAAGAAAALCAGEPSPTCAELGENLAYFRHGAVMEDEAAKGHRETFGGVEFRDEEGWDQYGPCRTYVLAGKAYMYCNHYFFLGAADGEGACGSSILGATSPECEGDSAFRWESARQRGLRLWREKVLPYYFSGRPDARPRAYYWLGRVAHLLDDSSVPGHLLPHRLGHVEFEHRAYEFEARSVETGPLPQDALPAGLDGLFEGLARGTLAVHDGVRAEACRREPREPGCEGGAASPSRTLESPVPLSNIRLINALMNGDPAAVSRPEILRERELARRQLLVLKPLTVAYTAQLLRLFGAQAALTPAAVTAPPPAEEGPAPARSVTFD